MGKYEFKFIKFDDNYFELKNSDVALELTINKNGEKFNYKFTAHEIRSLIEVLPLLLRERIEMNKLHPF